MLRPPIYMSQRGISPTFYFFSSHFHFSCPSFSDNILAMVTTFDLFSTILFASRLKIYDLGDQKIMITTSDDSERTRLIYWLRSKISIVPISGRSIDIISEPISGEKTANSLLTSVIAFWSSFGSLPHRASRLQLGSGQWHRRWLLIIMRVIVTPSELHIYPMPMAHLLIQPQD